MNKKRFKLNRRHEFVLNGDYQIIDNSTGEIVVEDMRGKRTWLYAESTNIGTVDGYVLTGVKILHVDLIERSVVFSALVSLYVEKEM
jgi:hypothetical protein